MTAQHEETRPDSANSELAQVIAEGQFSDRDVLEGILELLLSLAEKISGKKVVLSLRNQHGHRAAIGQSGDRVYYL